MGTLTKLEILTIYGLSLIFLRFTHVFSISVIRYHPHRLICTMCVCMYALYEIYFVFYLKMKNHNEIIMSKVLIIIITSNISD